MKYLFLTIIATLIFTCKDSKIEKYEDAKRFFNTIENGDVNKARIIAKELTEKYKNDSGPYESLAVFLATKEKYEEAFYYFEEALKIEPNSAQIFMNYGGTYFNAGAYLQSIPYLQKAYDSKNPYLNYLKLTFELGRAYHNTEDKKNAKIYFTEFLKRAKENQKEKDVWEPYQEIASDILKEYETGKKTKGKNY